MEYFREVKRYTGHPSSDLRRKILIVVCEYRDGGIIYRKAFHARPGTEPYIPQEGTHEELNALRKQY